MDSQPLSALRREDDREVLFSGEQIPKLDEAAFYCIAKRNYDFFLWTNWEAK